jgi:hypothetical protein
MQGDNDGVASRQSRLADRTATRTGQMENRSQRKSIHMTEDNDMQTSRLWYAALCVISSGLLAAEQGIQPPSGKAARPTGREQAMEVARIDHDRIVKLADSCLDTKPISLRDYPAPVDYAGPGDFYSMADYFWPNPQTKDGLPYINKDGQSNPNNFFEHRNMVKKLRDATAALAAAYAVTGDEKYSRKAVDLLKVFFLDKDKRMNPHLAYAQAVPGVSKGRSYGIIDTLHLAEVSLAIEALQSSKAMSPENLSGLKRWFADYIQWMTTNPNGIKEMNAGNNHSVAYMVQWAAFARLTGDHETLDKIRSRYRDIIVPGQMAADGSFPRELGRTKPYGYSIFQLDNMTLLCQLLSTDKDNLWAFKLPDGRGIERAMDFMFVYLKDKSKWPYTPDIEHFKEWPVRQPCLLLAGYALDRPDYLALWKTLNPDPTDLEVRRNMAVTQPLLWLVSPEDISLIKGRTRRGQIRDLNRNYQIIATTEREAVYCNYKNGDSSLFISECVRIVNCLL